MAAEAEVVEETPVAADAPTETQPVLDADGDGAGGATAKPEKAEKTKKEKKPKKGASAESASSDGADGPSIAAHPRAARAVAKAKGWGGLLGFALGGYLSLPTHTLAQAGLRALLAGIFCYVAAWAGAVFIWRRLVMLEIKNREHELLAAVQMAHANIEQRAGGAPAGGASADRARAGAAS